MVPKSLRYVVIGILFILPGEFLNQVLIHGSITNLVITIFLYLALLAIGYFAWTATYRHINPKGLELTLYALVAGILGLMGEWFLFGNAPWINPQAVQISMFSWWVGLFIIPRLVLETNNRYSTVKRITVAYYGIGSALYLFIAMKFNPARAASVLAYVLIPLLFLELWYIAKKWKEK